jgi:hypothetical protein
VCVCVCVCFPVEKEHFEYNCVEIPLIYQIVPPRLRLGICHNIGQAFQFPVDRSPRPLLQAIVSL